jgi:RHS repeat-associated protein
VIQRTILTAFGEPLLPSPPEGEGQGEGGAGNTRYGYAGAWGYESAEQSFDPLADLGWLHVGERYYDPAVGRFMQRDPIGIRGGLNTYAYTRNAPTVRVDPSGFIDYFEGVKWAVIACVTVMVSPVACSLGTGALVVSATGVGACAEPGDIEKAIEGWRRLFKWIVGAPGPQPIYPDGPVIGPW